MNQNANRALPTEPEALWALPADVLQALHEHGEDPRLKGAHDWRLQPANHAPGIHREPSAGNWRRMVEWTNSTGAWHWTALHGTAWQWPGGQDMATLCQLADQASALVEQDTADADNPGGTPSEGHLSYAWNIPKALSCYASPED
ncbi:hypothetical protein [Streptomyces sp. NPDC020681]|uniref:hypothetical protein n=1 Tax=Streptomyces sp. NPDC020681 TaxID=3365083 RepID=UPI003787B805